MATTIYWVSGDTNRALGVVLSDDGTVVDLTAVDAIECHQVSAADGTSTTIDGLSGDANGAVVTTFAGPLTTGRYTLEWQTTTGTTIITYPGAASGRPVLIVREEGD